MIVLYNNCWLLNNTYIYLSNISGNDILPKEYLPMESWEGNTQDINSWDNTNIYYGGLHHMENIFTRTAKVLHQDEHTIRKEIHDIIQGEYKGHYK